MICALPVAAAPRSPATLAAMRLLVSAIITGFGLKLGSDIYKYFKDKVGIFPEEKDDAVLQDGAAQPE